MTSPCLEDFENEGDKLQHSVVVVLFVWLGLFLLLCLINLKASRKSYNEIVTILKRKKSFEFYNGKGAKQRDYTTQRKIHANKN